MGFEGRRALVTEAASDIGAAVVRHLAREGARIVSADIDHTSLAASMTNLRTATTPLHIDFADPSALEEMIRAALDRLGGANLACTGSRPTSGDQKGTADRHRHRSAVTERSLESARHPGRVPAVL
ncbi:SDR family NAD(P)-dependent oxidoreductase [Sphingomonas sp. MMS24-JH45]